MNGHQIKIMCKLLAKSIVVVYLATMLFACKNDMKTISSLSTSDTMPTETARNIEVFYSDSGDVVIKLMSPTLKQKKKEEPYLEFPDGLHLIFYDSDKNVKTELTANYGISWENKKIMEVKDDVVIRDYEKDEVINTEHMIWDQRQRKIYSNAFVKRTTSEGVLYFDGFDADETFSTYTFRKPRGVFTIEDKEVE